MLKSYFEVQGQLKCKLLFFFLCRIFKDIQLRFAIQGNDIHIMYFQIQLDILLNIKLSIYVQC